MPVENHLTGTIHIGNGHALKIKADLCISESKIIWERDKKSIECEVKNTGFKESGGFYIRFYTQQRGSNPRFLMQRFVPKLKMNETFKYSFNIMKVAHNYEHNLNDVEKFIIKVDESNDVHELNEANNSEAIIVNTHHVPAPAVFDLNDYYPIDSTGEQYTKINFDLKKLKVIKTEDYGFWPIPAEDEPFLWVYGILIDSETLRNDNYVIKSKNYSHGNIRELEKGESAEIKSDVGHMSLDITPIPIIAAAGLGIIVIAFDEDAGPSNHAMKEGYRAGAGKINEIIKELKSVKKLKELAAKIDINLVDLDINISKVLKESQSRVETSITKAVTNGAIRFSLEHIVSDTILAAGALVDSDDNIGSFAKFTTYKSIKKAKVKDFTENLKGDGAHYRITVSITAQPPENYYKSFKNQLRFGDIILFSSEAGVSDLIQIPTDSKWSHIGIVYKEATENHDVMLLESMPSRGVVLTELGSKVESYDGDISFRHLNVTRTDNMKRALENLYRELRGRDYESSPKELVNAGIDTFDKQGGPTLNSENLSKVFCSELVAKAYQRMQLLSSANPLYPSNEFTPKDFSAEGEIDLLQGELLKELIIKK